MNFYLKYRPQRLDELDLAEIRTVLTETLTAKVKPHAWLLAGPKGTGKTSAARIIAKSLNCLGKKPAAAEPCNHCSACQSISLGTCLDVLEIDAASNRGIDNIRELKDKIKLAPASMKLKVYIIDEVHMLTKEAFNALLKTLEEPPAHATFILCTTEPEKLPETVISRCRVINFIKAGKAELVRSLNRAVKAEKLEIDPADLEKIVTAADGSFRDGIKLLEQLAAAGKKISRQRTAALLEGGISRDNLDQWLVLLYQQKSRPALEWLQVAWKQGIRPKHLALMALERLRQILLTRCGVKTETDLIALKDTNLVKQLTVRLLEAATAIKTAAIETLPLELLAAEFTNPIEPQGMVKQAVSVKPSVRSAARVKLSEKWPQVLEAVRPHNHSLEALLRATEPLGFSDGYLEIKVFYQFHKDRLEEDRYRRLIEQAVSQVLAESVKIKYRLAEKATEAELLPADEPDIIKTAEEIFGTGGD